MRTMRTLRRSLWLAALLLSATTTPAALITLEIVDEHGHALEGAHVLRLDAPGGAASGPDGRARLEIGAATELEVEITRLGHGTLRLTLNTEAIEGGLRRIVLEPADLELAPLTIEAQAGTGFDGSGPRAVERIDAADAARMSIDGTARGALAASAGADTRPCALCGSSGVGLQGLDPNYTEVLVDGLPTIGGLGALYGLDGVPVSALESLSLERGAGSAAAGGGAMAGRVELTSRPPASTDTLQLRLSLGDGWRNGAGLLLGRSLGGLPLQLNLDWQSEPLRLDRDKDRLTDSPQLSRLAGQVGVAGRIQRAAWVLQMSGMGEERFAGDVDWSESDRGSRSVYGREILNRRGELRLNIESDWAGGRRWTAAAGLVAHSQRSWYGPTRFDADQQRLLLRLGRDWRSPSGALSRIEAGFSAEEYEDGLLLAGDTERHDRIPSLALSHRSAPGVFDWEAGLRMERLEGDWHPLLRGAVSRGLWLEGWRLRASLGQGLRPVTLFSLDKAVHAGFDHVELPRDLELERSLSANLGLQGEHLLFAGRLRTDLSLYAVEFRDKAILRYTQDIGRMRYGNADRAYSRGVEGRVDWVAWSGWRARLGMTAGKVRVRLDDGWHDDEMSADWTLGGALGKDGLAGWQPLSAELRLRGFGPETLPEGRNRERSPAWVVWDFGLAWTVPAWQLGLDVENLLDWVQPDDPLVATEDGTLLDAALIYGPLAGRRLRFSIARNF
jgi:outer membrane receptor protein involved in Fe transport